MQNRTHFNWMEQLESRWVAMRWAAKTLSELLRWGLMGLISWHDMRHNNNTAQRLFVSRTKWSVRALQSASGRMKMRWAKRRSRLSVSIPLQQRGTEKASLKFQMCSHDRLSSLFSLYATWASWLSDTSAILHMLPWTSRPTTRGGWLYLSLPSLSVRISLPPYCPLESNWEG